jgi:preprotein translocase SecE subunit
MANMSSETKQNGKDRMADDEVERNEGESREIARPTGGTLAAEKPSFFAIYKRGQGYWTRMLTAGGILLILCLTAQFVYSHALATVEQKDVRLGVAVAIIAVGGIIAWYVMNKPGSVDFLIATDSEMKKVNWTSREQLIGSTKVVVLFMFLISFFLFGIDIFFGYFFYFIGVLKNKPF